MLGGRHKGVLVVPLPTRNELGAQRRLPKHDDSSRWGAPGRPKRCPAGEWEAPRAKNRRSGGRRTRQESEREKERERGALTAGLVNGVLMACEGNVCWARRDLAFFFTLFPSPFPFTAGVCVLVRVGEA